ncbi:hypothetical protein DP42_5046 [Burkholderia pseudomallei]|nr:hypothetical protein DP42_5046 [Burkholderia pseudomallei]
MKPMPVECRRAAPADAREPPPPDANGTPPTVISPSSGACRPARSLTSVDLPAPFWPISPCTVPRVTASDAPRSAATPPKRLTTRRTSSASGAPAASGAAAADAAAVVSAAIIAARARRRPAPARAQAARHPRRPS